MHRSDYITRRPVRPAIGRSSTGEWDSAGLRVECRDGPEGPVPLRFGFRGGEHEVARILDRWPGQDHLYVKLCTADGDTYILRCDTGCRAWAIAVFREAGR